MRPNALTTPMKAVGERQNGKTKVVTLPLYWTRVLRAEMMMKVLGRLWGLLGVSFWHYRPCSLHFSLSSVIVSIWWPCSTYLFVSPAVQPWNVFGSFKSLRGPVDNLAHNLTLQSWHQLLEDPTRLQDGL